MYKEEHGPGGEELVAAALAGSGGTLQTDSGLSAAGSLDPTDEVPTSALAAFQSLRPVTPDYATGPIMEGFNWSECSLGLEPGEWYMVVFRSVRREAGEHLTLEMYDYGAHIEAQRRGRGLLVYFRGTTNERRECLSLCIWLNRQEAARAARLPLHALAMSMVDEMYESYVLERYFLRKRPGQSTLEAELVAVSAGDANGKSFEMGAHTAGN